MAVLMLCSKWVPAPYGLGKSKVVGGDDNHGNFLCVFSWSEATSGSEQTFDSSAEANMLVLTEHNVLGF